MAMRQRESLVGTMWQSARHLMDLMRHMRPTWHADSLTRLSPAFLAAQEITGIIWDADGTLTPHHGETLHAAIASHFAMLAAHPGLRHLILSNAPESRFLQLGRMFPALPILRVYELHGMLHRRVLLRGEDSMAASTRNELVESGARALRKPHAALIHQALGVLDRAAPDVVMVGDQYLTDVAGAGLAAVRSIRVRTIDSASFPVSVRAAQLMERALFAICYGPGAANDQSRL